MVVFPEVCLEMIKIVSFKYLWACLEVVDSNSNVKLFRGMSRTRVDVIVK